ncbi:MAG: NYN domain-containing protein [Candidatus Liberibacter europaeus]|uniref:NYN domain-containing protein n=1 Tax=Candidatus Liberibacter europaeus TaxID=744859 RepID=A0A2T4VYA1_9HYPH|nr:NYN domain-containing protein [Candidatus Liberibacter europaeus]PTL86741.1 MAG: NYN domain-containing protein [Candidatus Liberibacter europaeus]
MFDSRETVALFIDGANLYASSKALGFDIDYRKLLKAFQDRSCYLLRCNYYASFIVGDQDQQYSPLHPLLDWLHYNGFRVVSKVAKEYTDSCGRKKIKTSMDIELAVDAFEQSQGVDHFVLFTGDGNYTALVDALQRKAKKVTIVSTVLSNPSMVSDQLRRQADNFIDLAYLKNEIERNVVSDDFEESLPPTIQHNNPFTNNVG